MIPQDYKEDGGNSGSSKRRRKRMRKSVKTLVGRRSRGSDRRRQTGNPGLGGGFGPGGRIPGFGGKP